MTDLYGFTALRADIAERLGVTLRYVEGLYPDERLHEMRRDRERAGVPLSVMDGADRVCLCGQPSHLSDREWAAAIDVLDAVFYLSDDMGEVSLYPRFGATAAQVSDAWKALDAAALINRDRCIASKYRKDPK